MPIIAGMPIGKSVRNSAEQRADHRERQREHDRERVDEGLELRGEHEVDEEDRHREREQHVREGLAPCSWSGRRSRRRSPRACSSFASPALDVVHHVAERAVRRRSAVTMICRCRFMRSMVAGPVPLSSSATSLDPHQRAGGDGHRAHPPPGGGHGELAEGRGRAAGPPARAGAGRRSRGRPGGTWRPPRPRAPGAPSARPRPPRRRGRPRGARSTRIAVSGLPARKLMSASLTPGCLAHDLERLARPIVCSVA